MPADEGRQKSRGSVTLSRLLQTRDGVDVAAEIGVARTSLSEWASGAHKPGIPGRKACGKLGIEFDAWDEPPPLLPAYTRPEQVAINESTPRAA